MEVSKIIQKRREALKLSIVEVAELSKISRRTVKNIETGRANPSLRILSQITEVLGMEIIFKVRE